MSIYQIHDLAKLHTIILDDVEFITDPINLFSDLTSLKNFQLTLCSFRKNLDLNFLVRNIKSIERLNISMEYDNLFKKYRYTHALRINNNEILKDGGLSLRNGKRIDRLKIERIYELGLWKNHTKLVDLDLSGNTIKEDTELSFSGLVNLEKLDLNDNNLKKLDSNMLNGLINLKWLNVSFCEIKDLSEVVFTDDNQKLEHLDLSGIIRYIYCLII